MQPKPSIRPFPRTLRFAAAALAVACAIVPVSAFQFSNGELKGNFDSTISYGGLWRLNNPSPDLYGTTNSFQGVPGNLNSVNTDDGNLNYEKGLASELLKGTHELELKYGNYGRCCAVTGSPTSRPMRRCAPS
jgi:hypothetical protein